MWAAFFRALEGAGFAPPEALAVAVNDLTGAALPVTPDGVADAGARRRAEVEAFAAAFWTLPPAERRARLADLSAGRADAAAARRLRQLAPGLDVPAAGHPDPAAAEVAALVRELFVLPPRERAVRRARWLVAQEERFKDVAAAARLVLRGDLPTARLDPRLFDWFAAGTPLVPVPPFDHKGAKLGRALANRSRHTRRERGERPEPENPPNKPVASQANENDLRIACSVCLALVVLVALSVGLSAWKKMRKSASTSGPAPVSVILLGAVTR